MNIHLFNFLGLLTILVLIVSYIILAEGKIQRQRDTINGYQHSLDYFAKWGGSEKDRAEVAESKNRAYATIFGRDPLAYHAIARRNAKDGLGDDKNRVVAVDLDGVILKYDGTWRGCLHFDEPIPGVTDGLKKLHDMGFKIIVYTTRVNPLAPGGMGFSAPEQFAMVEGVLRAWRIPYDYISLFKPLASYYIDDRAIRFTDWKQAVRDIEKIEKKAVTPMSKRLGE